jgi:hypothetical protein
MWVGISIVVWVKRAAFYQKYKKVGFRTAENFKKVRHLGVLFFGSCIPHADHSVQTSHKQNNAQRLLILGSLLVLLRFWKTRGGENGR